MHTNRARSRLPGDLPEPAHSAARGLLPPTDPPATPPRPFPQPTTSAPRHPTRFRRFPPQRFQRPAGGGAAAGRHCGHPATLRDRTAGCRGPPASAGGARLSPGAAGTAAGNREEPLTAPDPTGLHGAPAEPPPGCSGRAPPRPGRGPQHRARLTPCAPAARQRRQQRPRRLHGHRLFRLVVTDRAGAAGTDAGCAAVPGGRERAHVLQARIYCCSSGDLPRDYEFSV